MFPVLKASASVLVLSLMHSPTLEMKRVIGMSVRRYADDLFGTVVQKQTFGFYSLEIDIFFKDFGVVVPLLHVGRFSRYYPAGPTSSYPHP
jgi:hypothetical protein